MAGIGRIRQNSPGTQPDSDGSSLSTMVSVAGLTVTPGAVPVTRTVSSSSSSSSSVAIKETFSDEEPDPAAIEIWNGSTSEKSSDVAESPLRDMLTVVSVWAVPFSNVAVTDTVTGESASVTELGSTERFTTLGGLLLSPPVPWLSPHAQSVNASAAADMPCRKGRWHSRQRNGPENRDRSGKITGVTVRRECLRASRVRTDPDSGRSGRRPDSR